MQVVYFEDFYRNEVRKGFLLEDAVQYWPDAIMYPSQCWVKVYNPDGVNFITLNRELLANRLGNVKTQRLNFLLERIRTKQLKEDKDKYKRLIQEERKRILSFKGKYTL